MTKPTFVKIPLHTAGGAYLLLTPMEYARAIRRGKMDRRARQAKERDEKRKGEQEAKDLEWI